VAELECLEMIVDVRVRVCCATGVTTGGEEVVEVEVDEVLDEVDEVVDEDELLELVDLLRLDEEVLEDVDDLPAEDTDDALALDVLSFGVGVGGLEIEPKRIDIMPICLS